MIYPSESSYSRSLANLILVAPPTAHDLWVAPKTIPTERLFDVSYLEGVFFKGPNRLW